MSKAGKFTSTGRKLSRKKWIAGIYNFVWVAVITTLIWIWADLKFTDQQEFRATLRLNAGQTQDLFITTPTEMEIAFELKGSRESLDRFQRKLNDSKSLIEFDISPLGPGDHVELVAKILEKAMKLSQQGVSVGETSPGNVRIAILERIRKSDIRIDPDFINGELATDKPAKLKPSKTDIFVSAKDWLKITGSISDPSKITLRTHPIDLKDVPTGQSITRLVKIVPRINDVTVEPLTQEISVTFSATRRIESESVTIQVRVLCPPLWEEDGTWKKFKLVRRDESEWEKKITVTGPRQDLDKLKAADIQAFVILTDADKKPVSWATRDVQIRFPDDLDIKLIGERPEVSFKLEKVTFSEPGLEP